MSAEQSIAPLAPKFTLPDSVLVAPDVVLVSEAGPGGRTCPALPLEGRPSLRVSVPRASVRVAAEGCSHPGHSPVQTASLEPGGLAGSGCSHPGPSPIQTAALEPGELAESGCSHPGSSPVHTASLEQGGLAGSDCSHAGPSLVQAAALEPGGLAGSEVVQPMGRDDLLEELQALQRSIEALLAQQCRAIVQDVVAALLPQLEGLLQLEEKQRPELEEKLADHPQHGIPAQLPAADNEAAGAVKDDGWVETGSAAEEAGKKLQPCRRLRFCGETLQPEHWHLQRPQPQQQPGHLDAVLSEHQGEEPGEAEALAVGEGVMQSGRSSGASGRRSATVEDGAEVAPDMNVASCFAGAPAAEQRGSTLTVLSSDIVYVTQAQTMVSAYQAVRGWECPAVGMHALGKKTPQSMQTVSIVLVLLNSAFLGMQLEISIGHAKHNEEPPEWLSWASLAFTICFTVELGIRIMMERWEFLTGPERAWNIFDLTLVLSSWVDQALNTIRSLRVFRVVRAARMLRAFRFIRELRLMVASILCSLTSLSWAFLLLGFVLYMFAIIIMQGVEEHLQVQASDATGLQRYYGSLGKSMVSLFMAISSGLDWSELVEPLWALSAFYPGLFMFYVAFVLFGILNILTAIFVESAGQISDVDRDLVIQEELSRDKSTLNEIRTCFRDALTEDSKSLTRRAFELHLQSEMVLGCLKILGLDVAQARGLFELLETDDSGVDIEEFVCAMMRLKSSAKGVDIATVMYETKRITMQFAAFARYVETQFEELGAQITQHRGRTSHMAPVEAGVPVAPKAPIGGCECFSL